jgi:ABC-type ATPase with predicted acetyltransferase domain
MKLSVSHDFLPHRNSTRASAVMDHFGIGFEQGRHVIADDLELPIQPGQIVLFTGASGSGKSSLMRAAAERLRQESRDKSQERSAQSESQVDMTDQLQLLNAERSTLNAPALDSCLLSLDSLTLPDTLLIDALDLPVERGMSLLASCGLGEAQLMLRRPEELSDGQRYRFRLALALSKHPRWVLADEFTATLDRTLARVIAFNLRRLADRTGTGFLLATTHEDVADDLAPDLHVRCRLDGEIEVSRESRNNSQETIVKSPEDEHTEAGDHVENSGRPAAASRLKKKHLVRERPLDLRSVPSRLAVFRSVALPQPSPRAHPLPDAAVAWR